MSISQSLLPEFDQEMRVTRRYFERLPEDQFGWRPHEKSMTLGHLATHLAQIPGWFVPTLLQDELDMTGFKPELETTNAALLAKFDANVAAARAAIEGKDDAGWMAAWSLKGDGHTYFTMPKVVVARSFCMNHLIHHRAQLGVYLRLLGAPVPSTYGPSADEQNM